MSKELKEKIDKIEESCKRVYGTCKDGSYEACLHYHDYYALKKALIELSKGKDEQ